PNVKCMHPFRKYPDYFHPRLQKHFESDFIQSDQMSELNTYLPENGTVYPSIVNNWNANSVERSGITLLLEL
ncbi:MAG: hypothetical protein Q8862_14690, partial [Bacteroidota bacterium]|nr:hypothetical protein [Bacteroidota bacterium]